MTPERWQEIELVFSGAFELEGGERDRFVVEQCTGDPELQREVEALLASLDTAGEYFEELAGRIGVPTDPDTHTARLVGKRIGNYRLVDLIGRGGMGAVYLAERDDEQFQMKAALKLLPMGLDSDESRRRFLAERQILARLEHPNIARLVDGGVTEDSTPYFVMELVEGTPIDEYCDTHELTIPRRLALFLKVCEAVQHAHQNLVVHRDLKPSNILVTESGEVKLLDFGIARVLDAEGSSAQTTMTRRARPMTIAYASPEQILGAPVTTVSDVYALGVLLYLLLTGRHPYELSSKSLMEVEQVICEQEPERPSGAVFRTEPSTPDDVGRHRGTTPQRLRRDLAGDLDTLVLTALRKEPERRYASVSQFADDLHRYQTGLPVAAHRDTLAYRVMRFVGRHKAGVAAAALVALLTVTTAVVSLQFALTTRTQARAIAQERDKAERVSDFLVDLFQRSDPRKASGEELTARELLAQGAARVGEELGDQPEVRAEMLTVIGRVYHSLGLFEEARQLLEEGLALRLATLGEDHVDVADSESALAMHLLDLGQIDEAKPFAQRAMEISVEQLPDGDVRIADAMTVLASVVEGQGDFAQAEQLHRGVLAIRRQQLEEDDIQIAVAINQLALLLLETGDYDEAEVLFREALDIDRRVLGKDHVDVAYDLNNLGWLVTHVRGDYEEGMALQEEVVRIFEGAFPPDHPNLATVRYNLAGVMLQVGDYAGAREVFAGVLDFRRAVLGNDHANTALAARSLAGVHQDLGDYDAAEPLFREALSIFRTVYTSEHPRVAGGMQALGTHLALMGESEEAERLLREALLMRHRLFAEQHMDLATSQQALAAYLREEGSLEEAESLTRLAIQGFRATVGERHTSVAGSIGELAAIVAARGDPAEAESLWREAVEIQRAAVPRGDLRTASLLVGLGESLADMGQAAEGEAFLREALDLRRRILDADDWRVSSAMGALGECLAMLGDHAQAEELLTGALRNLTERPDPRGRELEIIERALATL